MTLLEQFTNENIENIRIYHYVEELVFDFRNFMSKKLENENISLTEYPLLLRIKFSNNTTQQVLAKEFHYSEGYTAKILKKFEEKGFISRCENPENRRQKIVSLTPEGIKYSDYLVSLLDEWEEIVTSSNSNDETRKLKSGLYKLIKNSYTGGL